MKTVRVDGSSYCCGVSDGFCPEDFDGVECLVSDPDCGSPGGVELCGEDYYFHRDTPLLSSGDCSIERNILSIR
ncbi:MAG: hypothetical protein JW724_07790 [Candidatus Altiarchaeota archaeon]|nr:hypothetical protein [Candidatus Altiarchaeota archaeon]